MKKEPETTDTFIFSEEEVQNITELVNIIKGIRARLIREGVDIDVLREECGITKKPMPLQKRK